MLRTYIFYLSSCSHEPYLSILVATAMIWGSWHLSFGDCGPLPGIPLLHWDSLPALHAFCRVMSPKCRPDQDILLLKVFYCCCVYFWASKGLSREEEGKYEMCSDVSSPEIWKNIKSLSKWAALEKIIMLALSSFTNFPLPWHSSNQLLLTVLENFFCLHRFLRKWTIATKLKKVRPKNVTPNKKRWALGILTHVILCIVRCNHILWFFCKKRDLLVCTSAIHWHFGGGLPFGIWKCYIFNPFGQMSPHFWLGSEWWGLSQNWDVHSSSTFSWILKRDFTEISIQNVCLSPSKRLLG